MPPIPPQRFINFPASSYISPLPPIPPRCLPASPYTSPLPPIPPRCLLYLPAVSYTFMLPPLPSRSLLYLPAAPYTSLLPDIPPRFSQYLPAVSYTSPLPPTPPCFPCIPLRPPISPCCPQYLPAAPYISLLPQYLPAAPYTSPIFCLILAHSRMEAAGRLVVLLLIGTAYYFLLNLSLFVSHCWWHTHSRWLTLYKYIIYLAFALFVYPFDCFVRLVARYLRGYRLPILS